MKIAVVALQEGSWDDQSASGEVVASLSTAPDQKFSDFASRPPRATHSASLSGAAGRNTHDDGEDALTSGEHPLFHWFGTTPSQLQQNSDETNSSTSSSLEGA